MLKTLLLALSSAILFAGDITVGLKAHNGLSSYTVQSNNSQNLKSKLDFPFTFNSIDLEYTSYFEHFKLNFHSSLLVNSKTRKGEDFDWKDDVLTVYSSSDNKIDTYYSFGLDISKDITKNFTLFLGYDYRTLDMHWSNTYQEDYIQNQSVFIPTKTLEFQQDFYQYTLGLDYTANLTKNIFCSLSPSLIYAYVDTKDIHILRDFYTIQNTQSLGYELRASLGYLVMQNATINLSFVHINMKDDSVDMNFHNTLGENYTSFPSSYHYKNSITNLSYTHKF